MKKKYHTLEELRGALARRQARWRERNRGYERVRARNNYEKARRGSDGSDLPDGVGGVGIAEGEPGEADSDIRGGALPGSGRDEGIGARGQEQRGNFKSARVGETTIGPVEGWDTPNETRRVVTGRWEVGEPGIIGTLGQGSVSREEAQRTLRTLARLDELKARQAEGRLNAGVDVELEI